MPQTFTSLHYHIVFSTKNREPWLTPAVRPRVYEYLGGLIRTELGALLAIGGMPDRVHLLARLGQTRALANVMRVVKTNSSRWVHDDLSADDFGWQTGYGAFTVGRSTVDAVRQYIETQEEHHRTQSYQDEFRSFLERHDLEYDERYLWD